jgi:hypothetical protein
MHITAFGDNSMAVTGIIGWFSRLKLGEAKVEDGDRSNRLCVGRMDEDVSEVGKIVSEVPCRKLWVAGPPRAGSGPVKKNFRAHQQERTDKKSSH